MCQSGGEIITSCLFIGSSDLQYVHAAFNSDALPTELYRPGLGHAVLTG